MDRHSSRLPQLQLTRNQLGHDGRAIRRARENGGTERLRRGFYVPQNIWSSADADTRYLMRIRAAVLSRQSRPVVSHFSAARVWGLPILGQWPTDVHRQGGSGQTRSAKNWIAWHHDPLPDEDVAGINARSGSVGESLGRTGIFLAAMPMPDLQVVYPHAFGEDQVDFRWKKRFHVKRMPLLGEFDGERSGWCAMSRCGGHREGWWRYGRGSGSLGRLSVCRIPASTFNTCTTLLLQKYCSRFSPKEVG